MNTEPMSLFNAPGVVSPTASKPAPLPAKQDKAASLISSDFETFLKMMTTQLKNQDPMNPMDSSEFAVQLATFSGVEQQVKTNQLLDGMNAQFGLMSMAQLAAWVGQEARASAPVYLGEKAVTILPKPDLGADSAVLAVYDTQGTLVAREALPLGEAPYQWFGADPSGNPLPRGVYRLSVESYRGEQLLGESTPESYARILEAQGGPSGTTLVLEGGVEVQASDVTALRVP